jgi:hypothetical protein
MEMNGFALTVAKHLDLDISTRRIVTLDKQAGVLEESFAMRMNSSKRLPNLFLRSACKKSHAFPACRCFQHDGKA